MPQRCGIAIVLLADYSAPPNFFALYVNGPMAVVKILRVLELNSPGPGSHFLELSRLGKPGSTKTSIYLFSVSTRPVGSIYIYNTPKATTQGGCGGIRVGLSFFS